MCGVSQSGFCLLTILDPPLHLQGSKIHDPRSCLQEPTKGPLLPPKSISSWPLELPPVLFCALCLSWLLVVGSFFFFFQNRILFEDAGLGLHKELTVCLFCLRFLPLIFAFRLIMSFLVPFPFPHCSSSNKGCTLVSIMRWKSRLA